MGKKTKQWYHDHINDPYVKAAKAAGYRSRAAFKLLELNEQESLLRAGNVVVDLGAAPGSWSEVASKRVGKKGLVVGIDLLPIEPIKGVTLLQGDFTDQTQVDALKVLLGERSADLVMSDMAPNLSGVPMSDQLRMMDLAQQALAFAMSVLHPEGAFIIKLFHGVGFDQFIAQVRKQFVKVRIRKPKASKSHSKEVYLSARNFRAIMPTQ